jgi:hypothetical protein
MYTYGNRARGGIEENVPTSHPLLEVATINYDRDEYYGGVVASTDYCSMLSTRHARGGEGEGCSPILIKLYSSSSLGYIY